MDKIIWSACFITRENRALAHRVCAKKVALTTPPGVPVEFEIGKVVVTLRFNIPDPFDKNFKIVQETCWLATREEFDAVFEIIDDDNRTETFALIALK